MTHKDYQDMIPFYLYDELGMNEKLAFEKHLESCNECKKEIENYKKVFNKISEYGNAVVDNKILMESRQELKGAIRQEKYKIIPFNMIFEKITNFMIKPSGLAISTISVLLLGLLIGYLIFNVRSANELKNFEIDQVLNQAIKSYLNITDIKVINSNPATGEIEFSYNITNTKKVQGNVNDPRVRSLLSYAVLNEQNPGIRLNSLNVINANQNLRFDDELRQTIFTVAKYDKNPGVRREALQFIREVPFDKDVKNTLIYVLLNDTSSGVRIEAMNIISAAAKKGVAFSNQDLTIFKENLEKDKNNYVRFLAKNIIKEY